MTRSEKLKNAITLMQDAVNRDLLGERKDAIAEVKQEILSLLLAEQKRATGCDWCKKNYKELVVKPCVEENTGIAATMHEGSIMIFHYGIAVGYIDTPKCLKCGRDMTEGESV